MPFIGTQPEVGGYSVLDALTASATASYTLQLNSANFSPASANQLLVSLNGVIQKPGSSFTVSGSTLTFSSALDSSDSIDFIIAMGEPLLVGTPSSGTVNTTQLVNNAVSTAKIANSAVTDAKIGGMAATKLTGTMDVARIFSGAHIQTVIERDTTGLNMGSSAATHRHLNCAITSKLANSSFLVRYSTGIYTAGSHNSNSPYNLDSDFALGMGFKTGAASTTSTDYTAISAPGFSRQNIAFASSTNRAFYSSDAVGGSANYMYRYHPVTTVFQEDIFSPSQAAGTVINVGVFASGDYGNSIQFYVGKSPSGFADSGYQSYITVTEIAP